MSISCSRPVYKFEPAFRKQITRVLLIIGMCVCVCVCTPVGPQHTPCTRLQLIVTYDIGAVEPLLANHDTCGHYGSQRVGFCWQRFLRSLTTRIRFHCSRAITTTTSTASTAKCPTQARRSRLFFTETLDSKSMFMVPIINNLKHQTHFDLMP